MQPKPQRKAGIFTAAFLLTAMFIGALCGFAVVDLSTSRYMPGLFPPMFAISAMNPDGLTFSLMGKSYSIPPESLRRASDATEPYRGLLPAHIRAGQQTALLLREKAAQALDDWRNRD